MIELYDYWEHTACIKEMSGNLFKPQNPFLQIEGATTPRYTPYIFLLALLKKITRVNIFFLLTIISLINFFILIVGIYLFCREYFNDKEQPIYTLMTLLFFWGGSFNFSSEYNLRFLTYTLFYPSEVTFSLSFTGFYYLVRFIRDGKLFDYWKYFALAMFIFLSHPLTGSFFLGSAFLITITEGKSRLRSLWFFLLSSLIIVFLLIVWPYYPFFKAFFNSVSTPWAEETRMYLYQTDNLYKMGPAILGVPIVLVLLIKRKYHFISFGFLIFASIYVFTYKPQIYLGERYIFYMIFFMHLALSWYLRTLGILSFSTLKKTLLDLNEKNAHVLIFAVIMILGTSYQIVKIGFEQMNYTISFTPHLKIQKYKNPTTKYGMLTGKIKEGDVVMSDPLTAWLLPTFTGAKIVALYHDNPLVPDNIERVEDSIRFYKPATPLKIRGEILKEYHVTHVLLNFERMEKNPVNQVNNYYQDFRINECTVEDLKKMGEIIFKNDTFTLFKLKKNYSSSSATSTLKSPV